MLRLILSPDPSFQGNTSQSEDDGLQTWLNVTWLKL